MEYRQLGGSGFKVPVLCLGTGTFGGATEMFKAWGAVDVAAATRLVDICLEAGLNMFDSADVYSKGAAEEILGQAIKGRREQVIISTKGTFRAGGGINGVPHRAGGYPHRPARGDRRPVRTSSGERTIQPHHGRPSPDAGGRSVRRARDLRTRTALCGDAPAGAGSLHGATR